MFKAKDNFTLWSTISFSKQILLLVFFNSLVALVINITIGNFGISGYFGNWLVSQIFGFNIFLSFQLVYLFRFRLTGKTSMKFMVSFLSLIAGTLLGLVIYWVSIMISTESNFIDNDSYLYRKSIQNFFIALVFGAIIINFFVSREKLFNAKNELQKHKLSILDNDKRMLESELKLLQSQIEPHFLFNTLSNIIGLIDSEPRRSKTMLVSLTHYLRATIQYTRLQKVTLEDELNMVKAYLEIFKERMGKRLHFKIDVDKKLHAISFPPMLIQPIVENAIKHGLEPRIQGGTINVFSKLFENKFHLIVEDSGIGMIQDSGKGIGLANVQQRIAALFDGKASIQLEDNQPSGLRVTLEMPYLS